MGIVKESAFDSVYLKIGGWMERFLTRHWERIPSAKKGELVLVLYPHFKNLVVLHENTIYELIAHITKHLGTEEGDVRKISERLRKRSERKGIKKKLEEKKLDIERLKKTLRHLTHLPF
jgi:hypothetical protein